jgi:hypothetical protein
LQYKPKIKNKYINIKFLNLIIHSNCN